MHQEVRQFIKNIRKASRSKYWLNSKFRFKRVLEVGSQNINGSPRKYFWFCDYTGIDISKGKGVDVVGRLTDLYYSVGSSFDFWLLDEYYDCIISVEMLEHDSTWKESLRIMYELLKPNGLMIITCASDDRAEHGTKRTSPQDSPNTTDYYRNISLDDFRNVLPREKFNEYVLQHARGKNDLQFYGTKKGKSN